MAKSKNNYLEVLDLIIEYHNGYGDGGLREHNFYDWISILPINLSVATSGYFAAIETKKNSAVVRAYKVVLEQALHDTNDKLSLLIDNKESLIKCKKRSKQIGLNYSIQTQFKKIVSLIDKL